MDIFDSMVFLGMNVSGYSLDLILENSSMIRVFFGLKMSSSSSILSASKADSILCGNSASVGSFKYGL